MLNLIQNLFNGGELSPLISARFDLNRYQSGSSLMLNVIPLPSGGFTRRPGMVYAGKTKSSKIKLFSFVFSNLDACVLEFGHLYMRVWKSNGVLQTKDNNVYELVTPYRVSDLDSLCFSQSADVIYVASPNFAPAKISRYGATDWRFSYLNFAPNVATPSIQSLSAGGEVPGDGKQTYSYVITAVNDLGEESNASGIREIYTDSLSTTFYINLRINLLAGITEYRIYKKKAGVYGFIGKINEGNTFRDQNINPDIEDTPPKHKNPFTSVNNYPSQVFFFGQRLGFASTNSKPLTFWLSQSANFESFSSRIPPKDDDAIEITLAGQQANKILWLQADRDVLIIGTVGGEYIMQSLSSGLISPSNIGFLMQSNVGSEPMQAINAGHSVLFIRRGSSGISEMSYSFQSDKYQPVDLSILSSHLFQNCKVTALAYAQRPYSIVWIALDNGKLIGLTYLKEHEIIAFHQHETQGTIEDIAVIPSSNGNEDMLWLHIKRVINGVTVSNIEIMHRFFTNDSKEFAFFVDSGSSYMGEPADIISGLSHLEGQALDVFADGAVLPQVIVKDGEVKLAKKSYVAHLGLNYTSEVRPLRAELSLQNGSSFGKIRRITNITMRVYQSLAIKLGIEKNIFGMNDLVKNSFATPIELLPSFVELQDISQALASGWNDDLQVIIKIDTPTPATVLAIATELEIK